MKTRLLKKLRKKAKANIWLARHVRKKSTELNYKYDIIYRNKDKSVRAFDTAIDLPTAIDALKEHRRRYILEQIESKAPYRRLYD